MLDNPTLEIDREKNEVTIKCNGDTIKFKDDNVEVTRASKNMMFKSPDITPATRHISIHSTTSILQLNQSA